MAITRRVRLKSGSWAARQGDPSRAPLRNPSGLESPLGGNSLEISLPRLHIKRSVATPVAPIFTQHLPSRTLP